MKNIYTILTIIILVLTNASCAQNKNKTAEATDAADEIAVEEQVDGETFQIEGDKATDAFFAENHIDNETRELLKIDEISYKRQLTGDPGTEDINESAHTKLIQASNSQIVRGTDLFKNNNGTIRRIYLLEEFPDGYNEVSEFLVSYNQKDDYVDSKLVSRYGSFSPITYRMVSSDTFTVTLNEAGEEWQENYTIQKDLSLQKNNNAVI